MSSANFLASGAFVWLGNRVEFGIYSLVWSGVQLTLGLQNATIITPLMANFAQFRGTARSNFVNELSALGWRVSLAAGLVGAGVTAIICELSGHANSGLAVATGVAIVGSWARELRRSRHFVELRASAVLRGDVAFVSLALITIGSGIAVSGTLHASWVLWCWGLAGLGTSFVPMRRSGNAEPDAGQDRGLLRRVLPGQIRWTLPSVFLSWLHAYAFGPVAALSGGLHVVGDLNAARLVASPVSLVQVAWNRLFLPLAGRKLASGDRSSAVRAAMTGALLVTLSCALYGFLLLVGHGVVHANALERKIQGLEGLIVLWLLWQFVAGIRGIGTNFLIAQRSFGTLFTYGAIAAGLGVILMVAGGRLAGANGIVAATLIGELLLCFLIWAKIRAGGSS